MSRTPPVLVCLTTVSDQDQARRIAKELLEKRVAACVQIDGPVESHYRWQDKVECETEYRLVIKTSEGKKSDLHDLIREIHPYDQPQIVTLQSVHVDPGYAEWVEQEVRS